MSSTPDRRSRTAVLSLSAVLAALVVPVSASAAAETFHRFEALATANFTIVEECADGSRAQTRLTVIGGHEEESKSGVTIEDSDFLTVRIQSLDCEGSFFSAFGTGPAEFAFSPSLQEASVEGTITATGGRTVTVDMSWQGTGALDVTSNTTIFPGFTGLFVGKRRDAVATGTVVVDGETVVDGTTTNARIETLEDTNTSTGAAQ